MLLFSSFLFFLPHYPLMQSTMLPPGWQLQDDNRLYIWQPDFLGSVWLTMEERNMVIQHQIFWCSLQKVWAAEVSNFLNEISLAIFNYVFASTKMHSKYFNITCYTPKQCLAWCITHLAQCNVLYITKNGSIWRPLLYQKIINTN